MSGSVRAWGERDDVQRAVELSVTAAMQPVAVGVAGAGRDGRGAGVAGEVPVGRKRSPPAVWPMMIAAVTVPQPGWARSCGACASARVSSSASSSRSSRPISLTRRSSCLATLSRGEAESCAS